MHLLALPALADNYIWLLHDGAHAVVVDPADAAPVCDALRTHGLVLDAVLVTHHHADHTGGINGVFADCAQAGTQVYLPAPDALDPACYAAVPPAQTQRVAGGDRFAALGLCFEVLAMPGHTAGHMAFYASVPGDAALLFCGDALFSAGCGRVFEGTPARMWQSLAQLAALPATTRVCCAHEYTLSNLRFARTVEPHNAALQQYEQHCQHLRARGLPTLPSTLGQEYAINPFLRCTEPAVQQAARSHMPPHAQQALDAHLPQATFAALRHWKDHF